MDVFQLRSHIIDTYSAYTTSFLNIADDTMRAYVHKHLEAGTLWPDALIQLSPSFASDQSVATLVANHVLHPLCAQIFGRTTSSGFEPLRLYRHQRDALDLAKRRRHYVVTTGTGSGKSLTYVLPIVDYILNHQPERGQVRAIFVYPMNALINSQELGINAFLDNLPPEQRSLIRVARYTGQEDDVRKREIQADPPHILLTNYVMLELMLTRPAESPFVDAGMSDLQFVVLDELHTYRGRQGADVALLLRRLRERSGNADLTCIGTSATMVSGEGGRDPRAMVAEVAGTIFGAALTVDQVVGETLERAITLSPRPMPAHLAAALQQEFPAALNPDAFRQHPLAAWIEDTYSLDTDPHTRQYIRAKPCSLHDGAKTLAALTGVDVARCEAAIRHFFRLGTTKDATGRAPFAFKLHQFISQGGALYATAAVPPRRRLTLEGQRYLNTDEGISLLYPQVFCRECGQHYALCAFDADHRQLEPRAPFSRGDDVEQPAVAGYLLVGDDVWSDDDTERLPDAWFRITRRGRVPLPKYREFLPQRVFVRRDGSLADSSDDGEPGWFVPAPFLTCLNCGVVYTKREDEFRKLARLSSEGRSTATTLLSAATVDYLRDSRLDREAQKLLSFTDNRQDASLQAGHFNDFAQVAMLRSGIARTIAARDGDDPLDHAEIARAVCKTLDLDQQVYAKDPAETTGARRRNEEALTAYLEYRIYEDLRRSWRVTQPNLEQCGLLYVDYLDLQEICAIERYWDKHPILRASTPADRERTARAFLDHLRRDLAIDAPCLDPEQQPIWVSRYNAKVNEDWKFDDAEMRSLRQATRYYLPSDEAVPPGGRSMSVRTAIGRYLRSAQAWPSLQERGIDRLSDDEYEGLLAALVEVLVKANLLTSDDSLAGTLSIQLRHDALLWCRGDGRVPTPDPIRSRRMAGRAPRGLPINTFYRDFYADAAQRLADVSGAEHTGQVKQDDRVRREQAFRDGNLSVLYCSPTMELGIDISDLNVVHMRNVPPTPANYAQRSGRAGRSGQAALVMTYCSMGSAHDQYFFRDPTQMVSGSVAPPQIELANEDLVIAHIHAIWLAEVRVDFESSILSVIDTDDDSLPLFADLRRRLHLDAAALARCRTICEQMLARMQSALHRADWYHADWLDARLTAAPEQFDRAFDRWRELYWQADRQLQEAIEQRKQTHRRGSLSKEDIRAADEKYSSALDQKDNLCNIRGNRKSEAEFYPYRYLAGEGFLPGYNFPRLPVRAFISTGDDGVYLARPRFLALSEFGPQNTIYHEGRKYQVMSSWLPSGGAARQMRSAKLCDRCGYFHEGLDDDVCAQCRLPLEGSAVLTSDKFFEMTMVYTQRIERITCEEEERRRKGYRINTHYRFAVVNGELRRTEAVVQGADLPGLRLIYGGQAALWRVNRGWRGSREQGFRLNPQTGRWNGDPNDAPDEADPIAPNETLRNVHLMVRDTRNMLVLECDPDLAADDERMMSLQNALQRGIKEYFQLEDQELQAELIGETRLRRILFWEASEGGAGVLRRLAAEPATLAAVARKALEVCHFDPNDGSALTSGDRCTRACYRCLLTYSNQPQHGRLDRYAVRDLLLALTAAQVQPVTAPPIAVAGAAAPAVQRVLAFLRAKNGREPTIAEQDGIPYLQFGRICVVCPDPDKDASSLQTSLQDRGRVVYRIDPERDVAEQLAAHAFWKER